MWGTRYAPPPDPGHFFYVHPYLQMWLVLLVYPRLWVEFQIFCEKKPFSFVAIFYFLETICLKIYLIFAQKKSDF